MDSHDIGLRTIMIESQEDWWKLRERGLMTVLDPLVMRIADLYFHGASHRLPYYQPTLRADTESLEDMWRILSKNIGSLITFVDQVLISSELPVFSYTDTFKESQLLQHPSLRDALRPVVVGGSVYEASVESAVDVISYRNHVPDEVVATVVEDLTGLDYDWLPAIDELMGYAAAEDLFTAFLLGGVLFDGYAQQLSIENGEAKGQARRIVQPDRASLLLAALGIGQVGPDEDTAVFDELMELSNEEALGIPRVTRYSGLPTFLPLILEKEKPASTQHLAEILMDWTNKPAIRDYREWLDRVREAIHLGHTPPNLGPELKTVVQRVKGADQGATGLQDIQLTVTILPAPGVGVQVPLNLLGVTRQFLPGGRHQRLLFHAIRAQKHYFDIERHLRHLWFTS